MRLISRILLLLLVVLPVSAQAAWRRAESTHFVVYSEEPEARLRGRITQLEDFHQLLVRLTDATTEDSPNKLHVYVVRNNRALSTVRRMGRDIGGFYAAGTEGVLAVVDASADGLRNNEILFHEYAHHFMKQYLTAAYPGWYVEGFAEFLMTAKLEADRIDIGQFSEGRVYTVAQGRWLPIERILTAGPAGLDGEGGAAYYAQAWLITHYFFSSAERQAALRRYLAPVPGETQVQALTRATGMSIDQFTRELRRYIGRGSISFRRMPRAAPVNAGTIQMGTFAGRGRRSAAARRRLAAGPRRSGRGADPAAGPHRRGPAPARRAGPPHPRPGGDLPRQSRGGAAAARGAADGTAERCRPDVSARPPAPRQCRRG